MSLLNMKIYSQTILLFAISVTLGVTRVPEKITYVSVEHPAVIFLDPTYVETAKATARRYGRMDPVYYFNLTYRSVDTFANNYTANFYFYEWLSNTYKRGFVEMHFRWCDLIHKDKFFGAAMKQGKLDRPCPFPPGDYELANMTISSSSIPKGFPFTKGRIYGNLTLTKTQETVAAGYVDMELKQMTGKKKNRK